MKQPSTLLPPVQSSIPLSLRPSIRSIIRLVSLTHRPPSPGPPARVRGQAGRGPHDAHRARRHSRPPRAGQGAPRADRAAHRRGPRPTWARLHVDRLRRRPVARHGRRHAAGGGRLLVVHSRHRAGAPHMHAPCTCTVHMHSPCTRTCTHTHMHMHMHVHVHARDVHARTWRVCAGARPAARDPVAACALCRLAHQAWHRAQELAEALRCALGRADSAAALLQ